MSSSGLSITPCLTALMITLFLIAFHMSRLLSLPAPIVIAHGLSMAEVTEVATPSLRRVISGQCIQWKREQVCASGDVLEGALVVELPHKLKKTRSPWQRTYRTGVKAPWQTDK